MKIQVFWQLTLIGWTNSSRGLQGSDCVYLLGLGVQELIYFITDVLIFFLFEHSLWLHINYVDT